MLHDLLYRLRSLFRRKRMEVDLDDEVRFHFEQQVAKNVREGMSQQEALRQARLTFGGIDEVKEECRDARGIGFVENTVRDLRFAARQFATNRGFALASVVVLALGIAANTAIFGFVDAVLVRPLPYDDPSRLVTAFGTRPETAQSQERGYVSCLDFLDWRERSREFGAIAAYDVDQRLGV